MALIEVWDKKTGEKVAVSEGLVNHWKLGKRYSRTPLEQPAAKRAADKAGKEPAEKKEGSS